jgi:hypothetical protein
MALGRVSDLLRRSFLLSKGAVAFRGCSHLEARTACRSETHMPLVLILGQSPSTALTADSQLQLGLPPNKQYAIEGVVFASSSSATPDIKIGWNFPAGVTVDLGYLAGDDTNYRGAELLRTANSASQTIPLAANTPAIVKISGTVVVGSSTSTLSFLFSQATSDANPTTVLRGSYLKAEEVVP